MRREVFSSELRRPITGKDPPITAVAAPRWNEMRCEARDASPRQTITVDFTPSKKVEVTGAVHF